MECFIGMQVLAGGKGNGNLRERFFIRSMIFLTLRRKKRRRSWSFCYWLIFVVDKGLKAQPGRLFPLMHGFLSINTRSDFVCFDDLLSLGRHENA